MIHLKWMLVLIVDTRTLGHFISLLMDFERVLWPIIWFTNTRPSIQTRKRSLIRRLSEKTESKDFRQFPSIIDIQKAKVFFLPFTNRSVLKVKDFLSNECYTLGLNAGCREFLIFPRAMTSRRDDLWTRFWCEGLTILGAFFVCWGAFCPVSKDRFLLQNKWTIFSLKLCICIECQLSLNETVLVLNPSTGKLLQELDFVVLSS